MTNCICWHGIWWGISPRPTFLDATIRLLAAAWAPGTTRSSRSPSSNLNLTAASVTMILQFLYSLFEEGKDYRTIIVYRSAILSAHVSFDGWRAGQHALVCRLLRGARLSCPPQPCYATMWDVFLVFCFFKNWPPDGDLTVAQLSAKLATLFCLISCKRVLDVRTFDI